MRAWFLSAKIMGFILQVARATCFRILPENIVDLIKKDHDFLKQERKETERNITFVNNANTWLSGPSLKEKKRLFASYKPFLFIEQYENPTYLFKIIDPYLFALKISTLHQGHAHFIRLMTLDSQSLNN